MTFVSPASSSTRSAEAPSPERQTPWSPEAEQAVLGAMLLDADAALKALELLDDAAFYRDAHRRLFRAMASLMERGKVIDRVLLGDELARRGDLEPAGGGEYIAVLLDVVPTAANVEHHCRMVKEKALLRRLIEAGAGWFWGLCSGGGTEERARRRGVGGRGGERKEAPHRGDDSVRGIPSGF